MNNINVCISCDDNYSKYAGVVIASILSNASQNDSLSIYILDGGVSAKHKEDIFALKSIKNCEINFIDIDQSLFAEYTKIKTHSYVTVATYYRLKLSSLLPNVDRIIYFDCDMVVNSSLKDLFNIEMDECLIAGVKDINKRMLKKNPTYVNAGMLVFDLKNMRKDNTEDKFLAWTIQNVESIKVGDQTIINEVCKNKIKIVHDKWNVQSSNFTNRSNYTNKPCVVHFVAKKKPWHWASFSYHRDLYFKYLQLTPWKLSEEEYKKWTKDNQIASLIEYLKYRPTFFLRPRFYEALFKTYLEPLFEPKKPIIKYNTFIVWEPCSKSHSEVVPGYVKYLLDLGYHVSVLVHSDRVKEGLFSRFKNENLTLNKMSKKEILKYFKQSDLSDVEGVLVTTSGKICDEIHFEEAYNTFNKNIEKSKIFLVSHESKHALDNGTWREKNITLRELNYKGAKSVVVNPHYFGDVAITPKNQVTNFVMVGAIKPYKKNDNTIIEAVLELHNKGITNFKITVIGKGHIKNIPQQIRGYFDLKGRLPFNKMYEELENADFLLTAYDEENPAHIRYNTTGTSGNFQLVYGFIKPVVITEGFASINEFDERNSIIYKNPQDYANAMKRGIDLTSEEYQGMQTNLKLVAERIYQKSLRNMEALING